MTNLSRLSDVPRNPVNIVYLEGGNNNHHAGTLPPKPMNNNNGWGDPSNFPVEYQTLPPPSSGRNSYYSSPTHYGNQPHSNPQSRYYQQPQGEEDDDEDLAGQLAAIRMKLEEKRKRMEYEKDRMENVASKQQAKLGKAAYLKAINKVSTNVFTSFVC